MTNVLPSLLQMTTPSWTLTSDTGLRGLIITRWGTVCICEPAPHCLLLLNLFNFTLPIAHTAGQAESLLKCFPFIFTSSLCSAAGLLAERARTLRCAQWYHGVASARWAGLCTAVWTLGWLGPDWCVVHTAAARPAPHRPARTGPAAAAPRQPQPAAPADRRLNLNSGSPLPAAAAGSWCSQCPVQLGWFNSFMISPTRWHTQHTAW